MKRIVAIGIFLTLLSACKEEKTHEKKPLQDKKEVSINESVPLNLEIIRIEDEMFNNKTRKGIKAVLDKYPLFSEKFLKRSQYPHDSILVNAFYQLVNNKSIDSIYQVTKEVYGDFSSLGYQFQDAFDNIRKLYPKFKNPKIYTVITGMGNDMYVNDSMVVIGLEFFLAEKCKYKPDFPKYIQSRYRTEYIVPMVTTMISNKYNQTDYLDNSLVAEMVYYGKSYYFLEKILPGIPDSLIAGYPASVLQDVEKNQAIIWAHFIDKKLLFETKHEVVNRYVGERPTTFEIGNKCPGRIGRWIGWQIVRKYMEKNDEVTLGSLMKEKDAKKIFMNAKYKPKKS